MNRIKDHRIDKTVSKGKDAEEYLYTDKTNDYKKDKIISTRQETDFLSNNNGDGFMLSIRKNSEPLTKSDKPHTSGDTSVENSLTNNGIDEDISANEESSFINEDINAADNHQKHMIYLLAPAFFIILAFAWTGFFIWSNLNNITQTISSSEISSLIVNWATPTILIAMGWLLFMRSSKAEAMRFGDVSNGLHIEAQNVQNKMREVNEDIALARDFLTQHSQDLEHIGRQVTKNLTDASDKLETALDDSNVKAEKLEKVSATTHQNLELLRKNLPVVNSAAKDATNMIGKAGIEVNNQINALKISMDTSIETSINNKNELEALSAQNKKTVDDLITNVSETQILNNNIIEKAKKNVQQITKKLKNEYQKLDGKIATTSENLEGKVRYISNQLNDNIDKLSISLDALHQQNVTEDNYLNEVISKIQKHIDISEQKIAILSDKTSEQTAKMAFALTAIKDNSDSVGEGLSNNHEQAELLIERSEKLLLALDSSSREMDETLPISVQRLEDLFTTLDNRFTSTFENIEKISEFGTNITDKYQDIDKKLKTSANQFKNLSKTQNEDVDNNVEKMQKILNSLNESKALIEGITETTNDNFTKQITHINQQIEETIQYSRDSLKDKINLSSELLAENGTHIIQETIDKQVSKIEENLQSALDKHVNSAGKAVDKLQEKLIIIEQMTDNIEKRIEDSNKEFSGVGEESFSRQMALLTESLNSTAIDVAKILSNDVTDNAWAAYLKGDRGVFTRRAVKLLTTSEIKLITTHYDENIEFREHVNRYIHDFEAMMRVLLSTRDGNAIGVTVLSSDVGKLYVALAQAIERLRN